jgi:hypothetical protein
LRLGTASGGEGLLGAIGGTGGLLIAVLIDAL